MEWERTYSTVRPHQKLGYFTPQRFLKQHYQNRSVPKALNEYMPLTVDSRLPQNSYTYKNPLYPMFVQW